MEVTQKPAQVQLDHVVDICCDVSKDTLNVYFELTDRTCEDLVPNKTRKIEAALRRYHREAGQHGYQTLRLICEPTGGYQDKLMRTARRMGFLTVYVSGEAVSKFRAVETNDRGKSDVKDPHIIHTLGRIQKVLQDRQLHDEYELLRTCGGHYEDADQTLVQARCRLHDAMRELHPDFSYASSFYDQASGRALMERFHGNPYRIVETGRPAFEQAMRQQVPRIRHRTLQRLWDDALASSRHQRSRQHVALLERHVEQLWQDVRRQQQRKADIEAEMVALLDRLRDKDPRLPTPTPGVISAKNLARLLAETGPLGDFASWRQLMRYAGLNICMRQSGKFAGQNKISKKGRPLLRKVLAQIVFPLTMEGKLYGDYYRQKRQTMPAMKARTAVMRLFLRKLHGWHKAGTQFDTERHFTDQGTWARRQAA